MNIQDMGAGAGVVVALIIGNAFVMKLIIDNAIKSLNLLIAKDFVTKEEFNSHIDHCQHGKK